MVEVVYILCALTSTACAVLLLRAFTRNRLPLLLWSGICFVFLSINNTLLFLDKEVITHIDLAVWRGVAGLAGIVCLLYGLIWESK